MFISDLQKKFGKRYRTFKGEDGFTEVALSDSFRMDSNNNSILLKAQFSMHKEMGNSEVQTVSLCKVPIPISNGLVAIDGVYYKFVNGLILKDGFYLNQRKVDTKDKEFEYTLSFIIQDSVAFKIGIDKELGAVLNVGKMKVSIYEYLLGLGVINTSEDIDNIFLDYRGNIEVNQSRTRGEISKDIFQAMFGFSDKGNYSDLLYDKTFNGFFGTSETYENKGIFFSYARYIGLELVNCSDKRVALGVVDTYKARQLDTLQVTDIELKTKTGKQFKVNTNFESSFTQSDLINAIKLLINANEVQDGIAECDKVALYNKSLFTYLDYVSCYFFARAKDYVDKQKNKNVFNNGYKSRPYEVTDFINWIRENIEKGKEPIPINNAITYDTSKDLFLKDLFRSNADNISQKERMFHSTYFGWINPALTSDGDKVGLTGQFVVDVCDNQKIRRKFTFQNNEQMPVDEDAEIQLLDFDADENAVPKDNETYLEPYQTYNKKIVFLEPDGSYNVYMNGILLPNETPDSSDLLCKTSTIQDQLSSKTPAIGSDQGKRQGLGNKAIFQSMPSIRATQKQRVGLKGPLDEKVSGVTAYQIVKTLLANRDIKEEALDSKTITVRNVEIKNNQFDLEILYDDNLIDHYQHPLFMPSVAENTRLKFKVIKSPEGTSTYNLNDYVISCGTYAEVGEECNVMFANLDGTTYEDGITVTSDFVHSLGLSTKLYFSQKVVVDGVLDEFGVSSTTVNYLNTQGLPKIGSFIGYHDVLCSIVVDGEAKTILSDKYGYVEDVIIKKFHSFKVKSIKIVLSDIRKLRRGDKLGNGHGNKGVIVKVLDSSDMVTSTLPKPDIIVNPLGTLGRMNLGQIKEILGNTLSQYSEERLTFKDSGVNDKSIKELTSDLSSKNLYKETTIMYNGVKLQSKIFIGLLSMYRMKQFSELHSKAACSPMLSVNQRVESGQKMSELCTNVYEAYGCSEELKYMMTFQSRNSTATRYLEKKLTYGESVDTTKFEDTSKIRISAMMNCIGFKMIDTGITLLQDSDINMLPVLDNIKEALTREEIHGKFNVSNPKGYQVAATVNVGGDIIMPHILEDLVSTVKIVEPGSEVKPRNIDTKILDKICISEEYLVRLSPYKNCVEYVEAKNVSDINSEWKRGYFEFVKILRGLDIELVLKRLENDANPTKYEYLKKIMAAYNNQNVFEVATLSVVPVAPINLRPQFDGRSGQNIDSFYNALLRHSTTKSVYNMLKSLVNDFKASLFQHGKSTAKPKSNEFSHAEKNAEVRDSTIARRYCYSGRSVAGFNLALEPYKIEIPIKIAMYMLETPLLKRIFADYTKCLYNADRSHVLITKNNETAEDKDSVYAIIKKCMSDIYSEVTCDETAKYWVVTTLELLLKNKACSMVREPILRRQGNYYFMPVLTTGDSINVNPIVCTSYNLDFDGDANSTYLCLSDTVSLNLLLKMNPYYGMYDLDTNDVWLKPNQDSLFGLYCLTKYKAGEVSRIIPKSCNVLEQLKSEVKGELLGLGDTVCIFSAHSKITDTVGNMIMLYTIISDPFSSDLLLANKILDSIHKGLTSKTMSDFIRGLDESDVAYEDNYQDTLEPDDALYNQKSASILNMINRINQLGFEVMTFKGTTLLPSELSKIRDSFEIREELSLLEEVKVTSEFDTKVKNTLRTLYDTEVIFTDFRDDDTKLKIKQAISDDLNSVEFLKDLINSGARGKLTDMYQIWDTVGNVNYDGENHEIKNNYNKGCNYIDMMISSQTVRSAKVDTQCNLGVKSNTIKERQLLASNLKFKSKSCNDGTLKLPVRYDVYYQGRDLSTYEKLEVTGSEELLEELNKVLSCTSETVFPGAIVSLVLQKLRLMKLNNETVDYKLSKDFISVVSDKYILYNDEVILGSKALTQIKNDLPKDIEMYSMYSCTERDGVCKKCYGLIQDGLKLDAVGMNTTFSIGQHDVQSTLDASKFTAGRAAKGEKVNILTLYTKSVIESQKSIIPVETLEIDYHDGKITVIRVKFSGETYVRKEIKESYEINPIYFDVNWTEQGYFIPRGYSNFDTINGIGRDDLLEVVYGNMLYQFVPYISVRSLDVIMCLNTRFIKDGEIVKDFDASTKSLMRYWLVDSEFTAQQDVLLNLILRNPMQKLISNALTNKKYKPNGTILSGLLGFNNIEHVFRETSNTYKFKHNSKTDQDGKEQYYNLDNTEEVTPEVKETYGETFESQEDDVEVFDTAVETTEEFEIAQQDDYTEQQDTDYSVETTNLF